MASKKIILLVAIAACVAGLVPKAGAQVYYTKNGSISFFSKTPLENISADNNQVISVLNIETGELQFSVLNNAFQFPKAKMEEDFNENYMESDRYPKSTFKGRIANISNITSLKEGIYKVTVQGNLMIHGVSKNITAPATITIKNGKISGASSFKIFIKDYNIKVPSIVTNKIAESIEVNVSCSYEKK